MTRLADLIRIEPTLLGPIPGVRSRDPQIGKTPDLGPRMAYPDAQGSMMGMALPMLAMGAMGYSPEAGAPEMPLPQVGNAGFSPPAYQQKTVLTDQLPFGQAFSRARKLGLQVFDWRGKQYTTELK